MARILVAGGAGFIGANLCQYLLSRGDTVFCIDNLYTGKMQNIKTLLSHFNFQYIPADVTSLQNIPEKIDEIYNLACPASPVQYQKNPIYTWATNVLGTLNLLKLAEKNECLFLQASTSEVYGDPIEHPQQENYWGNVNMVGVRSCYDEGKRAAETICMDFYRKKGMKIKIVRIFNTYGPKMQRDDGRVISNFIIQALQNEPITIYGSGEQTRSFCYIDDLILGLVKMMATSDDIVGPINIGNPDEITILEIAAKIKNMTNSKAEIIFKKLPDDDPKRRCPDITKAKTNLNWQPNIDLKQGLKETIEYFEKNFILEGERN